MKFMEIGIFLFIFLLFNVFGTNLLADESEGKAVQVVRSYFVDALDGKQPDKVYSLFAKDAEQYFNGYLNECRYCRHLSKYGRGKEDILHLPHRYP